MNLKFLYKKMGKVYLVGAGPGAVDLITVRGARLLARADAVLYDALIEPAMLDYVSAGAERIPVGKRCGCHPMPQASINRLLVQSAKRHDVTVRLKGGDPMLFARLDEELRALESAGVGCEIVPGVTAAAAASATLRRPLTLRGVSRSVAFATVRQVESENAIAEDVHADTLVFYMGRNQAAEIARHLIKSGRLGDTPVALVEACSTTRERTLTMHLDVLAAGAADVWFDPTEPSLILIGPTLSI